MAAGEHAATLSILTVLAGAPISGDLGARADFHGQDSQGAEGNQRQVSYCYYENGCVSSFTLQVQSQCGERWRREIHMDVAGRVFESCF